MRDLHTNSTPRPPAPRCTRVGVLAALAAVPLSWALIAAVVWFAVGLLR